MQTSTPQCARMWTLYPTCDPFHNGPYSATVSCCAFERTDDACRVMVNRQVLAPYGPNCLEIVVLTFFNSVVWEVSSWGVCHCTSPPHASLPLLSIAQTEVLLLTLMFTPGVYSSTSDQPVKKLFENDMYKSGLPHRFGLV